MIQLDKNGKMIVLTDDKHAGFSVGLQEDKARSEESAAGAALVAYVCIFLILALGVTCGVMT